MAECVLKRRFPPARVKRPAGLTGKQGQKRRPQESLRPAPDASGQQIAPAGRRRNQGERQAEEDPAPAGPRAPSSRPRGAAQPTPIGRMGWAVGCASALHARGPKPRPVLFERDINQRPDFNIAAYHTVSARRGGRRPRRPALPVFPVIPLAAGQPVTGISAAALPAPAEPPAPGFDTGTIRLPLGLCALSTHIPPSTERAAPRFSALIPPPRL